MVSTKRCRTCPPGHQEHPATDDWFWRNSSRADGFCDQCKNCMRAKQQARYRRQAEGRKAIAPLGHSVRPLSVPRKEEKKPRLTATEREDLRRRDAERVLWEGQWPPELRAAMGEGGMP